MTIEIQTPPSKEQSLKFCKSLLHDFSQDCEKVSMEHPPKIHLRRIWYKSYGDGRDGEPSKNGSVEKRSVRSDCTLKV